MNTAEIIASLEQERDRLTQAIEALKSSAGQRGRRGCWNPKRRVMLNKTVTGHQLNSYESISY
jgi:hypothetical protein